jgi:Holliday junction resolvase RusA-like endonuclease
MITDTRWFVLALTAQPWAIGPLGVGFRGKKPYAYIGPNQQLQAYQEALREELDGAGVLEGEVEVQLFIWRQLETAKNFGGRDRKAKTSDATNIQKATEDALQGILIENDRNVRRISTEIVAQDEDTKSCILVCVKPYQPLNPDVIPDPVWAEIEDAQHRPHMVELPWSNPDANPLADIQSFLEKRTPKVEDIF